MKAAQTEPVVESVRPVESSPANVCCVEPNRFGVEMAVVATQGASVFVSNKYRVAPTKRRRTVAGDKGYDIAQFVAEARELGITPHVAPNTTNRRSAIDGRTTRHGGHQVSQRIRKRIEEPFGWIKTIAGGRKLRYIGKRRNRAWFLMAGAVYNVLRIAALDTALA